MRKKLSTLAKKEAKNVMYFANEYNNIAPYDIESIFESLQDNNYLSEKGIAFREAFWSMFIQK